MSHASRQVAQAGQEDRPRGEQTNGSAGCRALRPPPAALCGRPSRARPVRAAYNLGNLLRRLVLPPEMARRSLTTLREKLVKIGARLSRRARGLILQMADVAICETCPGRSSAVPGACRRCRLEAPGVLPPSLGNLGDSPAQRCARVCCLPCGQLQALQSAMRVHPARRGFATWKEGACGSDGELARHVGGGWAHGPRRPIGHGWSAARAQQLWAFAGSPRRVAGDRSMPRWPVGGVGR